MLRIEWNIDWSDDDDDDHSSVPIIYVFISVLYTNTTSSFFWVENSICWLYTYNKVVIKFNLIWFKYYNMYFWFELLYVMVNCKVTDWLTLSLSLTSLIKSFFRCIFLFSFLDWLVDVMWCDVMWWWWINNVCWSYIFYLCSFSSFIFFF